VQHPPDHARDDRRSVARRRAARRRRRVTLALLLLGLACVIYLGLHLTVLAPADRHGAHLEHLTVHSRATGRDLGLNIVVPAHAEPHPPLLVFLHGRSGSSGSYTDDEAMYRALAALGGSAPAIAFPDGGEDSYWHDRRDGRWAGWVMQEAIPAAVRAAGADRRRIAIGGISMGGFGAYDLALHHPGRFCAVGGHSPALWLRGADSAAGAFDDAEDFARNDVIATVRADPRAFGSIPVWNDAGNADPFLISDIAFDAALRSGGADLSAHRWRGGHESSYWDSHWSAYLRFYARALARC